MFPLNHNFGSVIRGTGEAKVPMIIILIFTCGARVIWVTLVSDNIRLLCYTNPIAWGITIAAFFVYYKKGNWLRKHMVAKAAEAKEVEGKEGTEKEIGEKEAEANEA
jgi:Na+-driven multidrug efflux pump